ncbi:MAG: T9SS type A sorting domain-containing protein [Calditrichia bacterium]
MALQTLSFYTRRSFYFLFFSLFFVSTSLYAQSYSFFDDFERGDVGGAWLLDTCGIDSIVIDTGRLHISSQRPPQASPANCELSRISRAMHTGPELTDVTVQFDFDGGPLIRDNNHLSVFARYKSPTNHYRAVVFRDNRSTGTFVGISSESKGSLISSVGINLLPGRYEFSVIGNELTFRNVPGSGTDFLLTTIDDELTSGSVGFGTNEAPAIFLDNVSIAGDEVETSGDITGTVFANGLGLAGIHVALLDTSGAPVGGVDTLATNVNGEYAFLDVPAGIYLLNAIEPLGYSAVDNPQLDTLDAGDADTVDFIFEQTVTANNSKPPVYWSRQLFRHLFCNGVYTQVSEADLLLYIAESHEHYDPHFTHFSGESSLVDWWKLVRVWRNFSKTKRARRQVAALVLNLMSNKVGQYTIVTADGRTAGDVLTYVSNLLADNNVSNDNDARKWAAKVNRRQTIPAGAIPVSNVLYKDGSSRASSNYGIKTFEEFTLLQNYPNPFNPSTHIEFYLPGDAFTSLKIYNPLGEEVAELVNKNLSAGRHVYNWHAGDLSSGVYFFRLQAGSKIKIGRALLMK